MPPKTDWLSLTHEQRVQNLANRPIAQIAEEYSLEGHDTASFTAALGREFRLWNPKNVSTFREAGKPPTKDVVLGAWRDLERSEAVLELTDNSIDTWLQRRHAYPKKTAPELNIYIDVDPDTRQLTYEDNAGGVPVEKLEHLVVPGYSDTTPFTSTIGSYKTGGKKAIFRLATAAQVATRYWSPAETSDDAVSVQLDQAWINNPTEYRFPYASLKDKSVIDKGQTRFVLQLREEPLGGPLWFEDPEKTDRIVREIKSAYTLLMIRNPAVHIFFRDRQHPLQPDESLYDFSGTADGDIDIRPQQVVFDTEMDYEGQKHKVAIEVVLGCRRTGGVRAGAAGGIDLYGNDRLFVSHDQTIFAELLPAGAVRNYIRGFVNIKGPNVFIPWDTHKRHINLDRDVINVITRHLLIRQLFDNWKQTYLAISRAPEVVKLINTSLPHAVDRAAKDLFVPHRARVDLDLKRKRGVALPTSVFVPKVKTRKRRKDGVNVTLKLTTGEARLLASHYQVQGDMNSRPVACELSEEIKADLLNRAARGRR